MAMTGIIAGSMALAHAKDWTQVGRVRSPK